MMREQPLPGGNVGGAVLVDGTVRRPVGPWTPAVHALLDHLSAKGFAETPRALGFDEQGREIVTYIPGETIGGEQPGPAWEWDEQLLVQMGGWLRRYHDAVEDFVPPSDAVWRFGGALGPGRIICHNDIGPYNAVWDGGLVGVIDWDFAGPAVPGWDLAYAAWTVVPLHHPGLLALSAEAPEIDQAPDRLRRFLDAYGLRDRSGFLDLLLARIDARGREIVALAERGDIAMQRLLDRGHLSDMARTSSHVRRHLASLESALD
jgi:Phosphotransferase enzyme family